MLCSTPLLTPFPLRKHPSPQLHFCLVQIPLKRHLLREALAPLRRAPLHAWLPPHPAPLTCFWMSRTRCSCSRGALLSLNTTQART